MKINSVYFYQSVKIERAGGGGVSSVTHVVPGEKGMRGIVATFEKGLLKLSHKDWNYDYFTGLANIKSMQVEKGENNDGNSQEESNEKENDKKSSAKGGTGRTSGKRGTKANA